MEVNFEKPVCCATYDRFIDLLRAFFSILTSLVLMVLMFGLSSLIRRCVISLKLRDFSPVMTT